LDTCFQLDSSAPTCMEEALNHAAAVIFRISITLLVGGRSLVNLARELRLRKHSVYKQRALPGAAPGVRRLADYAMERPGEVRLITHAAL
jgi:hypothetical protein